MSSQIDAVSASHCGASSLDQVLARAMTSHYAWEFEDAQAGYRAVLQCDPKHADANHNLGVLMAVQLLKPIEALPLLEAALDAEPRRAQFWLSYIDALTKAGLFEAAHQVLPLARLQGVSDNMIGRLTDGLTVSQLPVPVVKGVHWSPIPSRAGAAQTPPPVETTNRPLVQNSRVPSPGARDMQQLVMLFNRGENVRGERLAQALVLRYPAAGAIWKILGALQHHMGMHAQALESKRRAAALLPDDPEALCNLGNTLVSAGFPEESLAYFDRAVLLRPRYAQAHFNHGNALLALERFVQAEVQFRLAREVSPGWADAHSNLGFALKAQGRLEEAAQSYSHALAAAPGDPTTLTNLGLIQDALGQGEEALLCFRQALSKRSDDAAAHGSYGAALHKLGKLSLAESAYRRALQLEPGSPPALKRLGLLLQQQGRFQEAETCLRLCLAAQPELASAYFDLGTNLIEQKKWDEAERALRAALDRRPSYVEAHINLSKALYERGDYESAVAAVKKSLEILPHVPSLQTNLGVTYTMQGRVDDAIVCYRRALEIDPNFDYARSCMLYALSHSVLVGAQELAFEHRRYGEILEGRLNVSAPVHRNDRTPERALRVGFVSADFREHALAKFFEPFIAQFSKRPDVACFAYYNHAARDATTRRIDDCFNVWRPVVGLSDERLCQQIQDDGIDILFDLTSHTAGNRLAVFARKPAPVQITWMGYPGSTGLKSMDYRFVEHFFLPSDGFSEQFVEKLVQLPLVSPFNGLESMPDTVSAPCLRNGHLTFGSFNRLSKINKDVVLSWACAMRAVPDARLVLAGLSRNVEPEQIIEWFQDAGVTRDRLSLHARTGFYEYMQLHNSVDIGLDTFPYTGGTTTNHALWMGVPTLTIAGDTLPSRQSAVFLNRVGLRNFIATDVDGLVTNALFWSQHPEGLNAIRTGLREQLLAANQTQLETVVAGVSAALRVMWRRWCCDLAPEAFKVDYEDIGARNPHQSQTLLGST